MKYAMTYKRWSAVHNNFVLVDEVVEAEDFYVTEAGAIVFHEEGGRNIKTVAGGGWMNVEPAPAENTTQPASPVLLFGK